MRQLNIKPSLKNKYDQRDGKLVKKKTKTVSYTSPGQKSRSEEKAKPKKTTAQKDKESALPV